MANEELKRIKAEITLANAQRRSLIEQRKNVMTSISSQPKALTKWIGAKGEAIPAPMLSKQQQILNEMFGGSERTWGTGRNLPVINNALNDPEGIGLVRTKDNGATGRLFGMRR